MNNCDVNKILRLKKSRDWEPCEPAQSDSIQAAKDRLPNSLPPEFFEFFRFSNGGNGSLPLPPYRFSLAKIEEMPENIGYEKYLPDYLLPFGTNGSDEIFVFDLRKAGPPVCCIPFLNSGDEDLQIVCADFCELLRLMGEE